MARQNFYTTFYTCRGTLPIGAMTSPNACRISNFASLAVHQVGSIFPAFLLPGCCNDSNTVTLLLTSCKHEYILRDLSSTVFVRVLYKFFVHGLYMN